MFYENPNSSTVVYVECMCTYSAYNVLCLLLVALNNCLQNIPCSKLKIDLVSLGPSE